MDWKETFETQMRRLAGYALETLPRMLLTEGEAAGFFCDRVRPAAGGLELLGVSPRYSIMALIGVAEALGAARVREGVWGTALGRVRAMAQQTPGHLGPGNLGLMLWLDRVAELDLARPLAAQLRGALAGGWRGSARPGAMQAAWLLTGAVKAGLEDALLGQLHAQLMESYRPAARMFALGGASYLRGRFQSVLGSFAAQIYPLLALAEYGQAGGGRGALETARAVAGRICELQGPAGEWWWIVDTRTAAVYLDYPVYSVHQDAMAPMGLLAAARALGEPRYVEHAARGVAYLFAYRATAGSAAEEEGGAGFWDTRSGLIRRAVARDYGEDPADLPFGLSRAEMVWMRQAALPAWLRGSLPGRLRPVQGFRFVREARPYCLGWILHAAAQARAWAAGAGLADAAPVDAARTARGGAA